MKTVYYVAGIIAVSGVVGGLIYFVVRMAI